jgi:23S rRNA pseudouridine1911/1915/1917 synthase
VHFAHEGAQILGDDLYGVASELIGRHALHAVKIEMPRMSGDGTAVFEAPLPDDMLKIIENTFGKEFKLNGRK